MNYNDQILENKTFKFVKQLMYNIAVALCILLFVALVMVFGFNYRFYNVLTGSEEPYIYPGDMVIVKVDKNVKVGEIVKYNLASGTPVTHRLFAIVQDSSGNNHYFAHGDNNAKLNLATDKSWQASVEAYKGKTYADIRGYMQDGDQLDDLTIDQIEGKVVNQISHFGAYFTLIREHIPFVVAMLVGIWGISATVGIELELKRATRLM